MTRCVGEDPFHCRSVHLALKALHGLHIIEEGVELDRGPNIKRLQRPVYLRAAQDDEMVERAIAGRVFGNGSCIKQKAFVDQVFHNVDPACARLVYLILIQVVADPTSGYILELGLKIAILIDLPTRRSALEVLDKMGS